MNPEVSSRLMLVGGIVSGRKNSRGGLNHFYHAINLPIVRLVHTKPVWNLQVFLCITITNLSFWHDCHLWCNISNPTMRTGRDFESAQFDQVRGEAEDWIKMRGFEIQRSSPHIVGGFEITSRTITNKSPLKVRWINHFWSSPRTELILIQS